RLGHPVVARGSLQRANWRWSRPPRLAHRARTPGRPVHAKLGHATCRVRLDSAHFAACRAAPPCAPISHHLARPSCVSPSSCSKLTPTSRSVPTLHNGGCPPSCKTRFRLLARLFRAGLVTRRVPAKVSRL